MSSQHICIHYGVGAMHREEFCIACSTFQNSLEIHFLKKDKRQDLMLVDIMDDCVTIIFNNSTRQHVLQHNSNYSTTNSYLLMQLQNIRVTTEIIIFIVSHVTFAPSRQSLTTRSWSISVRQSSVPLWITCCHSLLN